MTHSARDDVLALSELLEMILLEMPLRDVLLAQRVSRTWQHAIKTSARLQKALFFRPVVDFKLRQVGGFLGSLDCASAKVCDRKRTVGNVPPGSRDRPWAATELVADKSFQVTLNPFVHPSKHKNPRYSKFSELWMLDDELTEQMTERPGADHPQASWRSMLLTQPPTVDVAVIQPLVQWNHWHKLHAKQGSHGITLIDADDSLAAFGCKSMILSYGVWNDHPDPDKSAAHTLRLISWRDTRTAGIEDATKDDSGHDVHNKGGCDRYSLGTGDDSGNAAEHDGESDSEDTDEDNSEEAGEYDSEDDTDDFHKGSDEGEDDDEDEEEEGRVWGGNHLVTS